MRGWEVERDQDLEGHWVRPPYPSSPGSPPLCLQPPPPLLSLPPAQLGHCQGLQRGCVPGMLVPPGDSGNFSIQHFLWERWAEGHWKVAFRALGLCPALEAEEGSLTVAKGRVIFNSIDMGSVQKCDRRAQNGAEAPPPPRPHGHLGFAWRAPPQS